MCFTPTFTRAVLCANWRNKDGLTNLQEYLDQSDPTVPAPVYKVGDVWDLSTVHERKTSFNPDPHFHDTPLWHYL